MVENPEPTPDKMRGREGMRDSVKETLENALDIVRKYPEKKKQKAENTTSSQHCHLAEEYRQHRDRLSESIEESKDLGSSNKHKHSLSGAKTKAPNSRITEAQPDIPRKFLSQT